MSGQTRFNNVGWENKSLQEQYEIVLEQLQNVERGGKGWNDWQLQTLAGLLKTGEGFQALFTGLLVNWPEAGPIQTVLIQSLYQLSDAEFQKIDAGHQPYIIRLFLDLQTNNKFKLLLNEETQVDQFHVWQKAPLLKMLNNMSDLAYAGLDDKQKLKLSNLPMVLSDGKTIATQVQSFASEVSQPTWLQRAWIKSLFHHKKTHLLVQMMQIESAHSHIAELYKSALLENNLDLAHKLAEHLGELSATMLTADVQPEIERRRAEEQRRAEEADRLEAEKARLAKEKEDAARLAEEQRLAAAQEEAELFAELTALAEEAERTLAEEKRAAHASVSPSKNVVTEEHQKPEKFNLWKAIKNAWQQFKAWVSKKFGRNKGGEDAADEGFMINARAATEEEHIADAALGDQRASFVSMPTLNATRQDDTVGSPVAPGDHPLADASSRPSNVRK